ncbi:hypothetical protein [Micromonospora sp. WMMD980]|uniref:hypothetical protein n=1 Tax=Micromonospora sp. WMMD980 TaxID=3016088 RepID=UPI002416A2DB|nr:hypothetical protein [Micromonospora sp. WMMD980]MDG4799329.1 hypothetical protein [Micromonospora sp. WMMD980]
MRYRRVGQRHSQPDRSFTRRIGYETAKEGGGTLLQQAGAALGALAGLMGSTWGLPPSASVITGAIVGGTLGSVGKGFVAASLDQLRERREEQQARTSRRSSNRPSWRHAHAAGSSSGGAFMSSRRGGTASVAGQVIGGIEQIIEQLERTAGRVANIHQKMWASQNALLAVLAGGRPDIVRTTEARLTTARGLVHDSTVALAAAKEELRAYRSRL